jgi:hypothetical protein
MRADSKLGAAASEPLVVIASDKNTQHHPVRITHEPVHKLDVRVLDDSRNESSQACFVTTQGTVQKH